MTMTFAATPLLQQALPEPFQNWLTPLLSDRYDPHLAPRAQKRGLLIGMGMTENRAARTYSATLLKRKSAATAATGWWDTSGFSPCHKAMRIWCWRRRKAGCPAFCSSLLPDGQRNAVRPERLKDKLGNRSNASSEAEFLDASGWLLGKRGRGTTDPPHGRVNAF